MRRRRKEGEEGRKEGKRRRRRERGRKEGEEEGKKGRRKKGRGRRRRCLYLLYSTKHCARLTTGMYYGVSPCLLWYSILVMFSL